jgi:cytochrome c oxidase assembly protein subunit 11
MQQDKAHNRANGRVVVMCVAVAAGMVGLSYAAVPLYRMFCQVTGYGGTTQRAEAPEGPVLDRMMTVRFDANSASDMNWDFAPAQAKVEIKVGEQALAFYRAENRSPKDVTGTATFNVSPPRAGAYFSKIECFCFTEQTLKPGESIDMPVAFFVDPDIAKDEDLRSLKTITLSYTFYRVDNPEKTSAAVGGEKTKAIVN